MQDLKQLLFFKDPQDIDDDQYPDARYFPHKGEEIPTAPASPILLVKRVKTFKCQPWWHRETMDRLGLGEGAPEDKIAVLPNMPTICYKLFSVKHLIEIIPLKFPMGFPSDEEFDPSCCRINSRGEFLYHPKLKVEEVTTKVKTEMLLTEEAVEKKARRDWYEPYMSPLGNVNFHRETRYENPKEFDRGSDPLYMYKKRFSEKKQ